MITLCAEDYGAIARHAEQTYPDECCGLLLGWRSPDANAVVTEVWALRNAWSAAVAEEFPLLQSASNAFPTARRRYWIDPADLLRAQRYVRQQQSTRADLVRQFDMIGIYHSHPEHPAVPSECDRACAWSEYSYIIVSVQQGRACDLLSWKLDNTHQFQPERLNLVSS